MQEAAANGFRKESIVTKRHTNDVQSDQMG